MRVDWLYTVQKTHVILWFALAIYLIVETIRTWYLALDYPMQMMRWMLLFSLLIPLYFVLKSDSQKRYEHLLLFIVCCSIVYAVAYLLQGLLLELNHASRFSTQGTVVAGSSYAVLPFLITMPAVIKAISSPNTKIKALSISCVVLMVAIAFYYDSRVLTLVLTYFGVLVWFVLSKKQALYFDLAIILTWFILACYVSVLRSVDGTVLSSAVPTISIDNIPFIPHDKIDVSVFANYGDMFADSAQIITNTRVTDGDRIVHIIAPVNAIIVNPLTFLFGYGTYEHHSVLQPFMQSVVNERGIDAVIPTFTRTTGFGAFITDYGIIGSILLISNAFCGGLTILLQKTRFSLVLASVLGITIVWLLISNILDNVLLWLILIPFGILYKLGLDKQ